MIRSFLIIPCVFFLTTTASEKPLQFLRAKDFIIGGIVAGGTLEFVNFVAREGRYKKIFHFSKRHPGLTIAGISAGIGGLYLYGEHILEIFKK